MNPARINPDTRRSLLLAMAATGGLALVSAILSFAGLSAIAPWAAVPEGLAPLVPLFVDGAILVYTYSALAARARGESAARSWTWVALWTAVSAGTNAAHAATTSQQAGVPLIVGAVLAGLFPIGSLLATHEIADRMIARPDETVPDGTVPGPEPETVASVPESRPTPRPRPAAVPSRTLSVVPEIPSRVREMKAAGHTVPEIVAELGIGRSTVYRHLAETA